MGNFRQGDRGSRFNGDRFGNRSGGNRFRNDRGDRRPREMHDAICNKCGKNCQIPFKPQGNKPILCSDCFRQNGNSYGNNSRPQFQRSVPQSQPAQSSASNEQLKQINAKLDKIIKIMGELELDTEDEFDDLELEAEDLDEEEEGDGEEADIIIEPMSSDEDLEDDEDDEEDTA